MIDDSDKEQEKNLVQPEEIKVAVIKQNSESKNSVDRLTPANEYDIGNESINNSSRVH